MRQVTTAAPQHPPLARFLLRNFVIYNPLFLFSATLVLGGAWLLNPPQASGGRSVSLLLQLMGVIQAYELTLLGAAALLWKKGDLKRDVRNLILVLAPFLLDITFTTSSLGVSLLGKAGLLAAAGLATAILALTWIKLRIATGLLGLRLERFERTALLLGPAVVVVYPIAGTYLALHDMVELIGLIGGLGIGAMTLMYGLVSSEREGGRALRAVAPLILFAALVHAGSTTWAYTGTLAHLFGPVLIALGAVLHRLSPRLAPYRNGFAFALPIVGAGLCGVPAGWEAGISWPVGLMACATVHAVFFRRTKSLAYLAGVLCMLHLAWGGATLAESIRAVGHNPAEPLLLLALFGYGVWRRSHPAVTGVPLALAAILTGRLTLFGGEPLDLVLALDVIGVGILIYTHRVHGAEAAGGSYRLAGAALLWAPVSLLVTGQAAGSVPWLPHLVVALLTIAGLVGLAIFTRQRVYAFPALLPPLWGAVEVAPTTAAGWGVVGLLLAFVVVSLGVAMSLKREQILAWLSEAEEQESQLGARVVSDPRNDVLVKGGAAMGVAMTLMAILLL